MIIECKIVNGNAEYKNIIIRRFYQKVFWEQDLKSFIIDTAIVVGASNDDGSRKMLKDGFNVGLHFSGFEEDDKKAKIESNVEDKYNVFIKESEPFKTVWGPESRLIEDHNEFTELYQKIYDAKISIEEDIQNKYFYIAQNDLAPTISQITSIGEPVRSENSCRFSLKVKGVADNIEIMNFSSVRISFAKMETAFEYRIAFSDKINFDCLDNSLFFVLPKNYDFSFSELLVKSDGSIQAEPFTNPLTNIIRKSKEKYFKDWIARGIFKRNYAKVNTREIKKFKGVSSLQFDFAITDNQTPLIKKFIGGLIVSLFLSYCLDQNRLLIFNSLFIKIRYITPDFNFVATYGLLVLTYIIKLNVLSDNKNGIIRFLRNLGLLTSAVWFIFVYVYCGNLYYGALPAQIVFPVEKICISWILNGVSFLLNFLALSISILFHRDEINLSLKESWNNIFK